MLVEDNRSDALITQAAIESAIERVRVISFLSGEEALAWLEARHSTDDLPDLILTDLHLSEMNGIDFLKALKGRENLLSIPVLLFSSLINPQDEEIALKVGAREVIEKPIDFYESVALFSRVFLDLFPSLHEGNM